MRTEPKPHLSPFAQDLLLDLGRADPWAGEGINRAVSQYHALWLDVDDADPAQRTPEDVVNYLASETLAMIIVTADMLGDPMDLMESLSDQLLNLLGRDR